MSYSQTQGAAIIRSKFGFRGSNAQVVNAFQFGYNLGAWLTVDGEMGPATSAALARSAASGRCSNHFSWAEFRCKCGGRYSTCRRILINRQTLRSLESYRANIGNQSVNIVSGYRCPSYNAAVGGASDSQHLYGSAADIGSPRNHTQVAAMHLFGGIGYAKSNGLVKHVDRRDVSGHNNGGSLSNPMQWVYSTW